MKVLFLDIDGVLNRNGTKERYSGFVGLDKVLLDRFLNWMKTQPDLKIVLSSSWRIPVAFGDFPGHLKENGIDFIDVTPRFPALNRGFEINAWLKDHPEVTHYAVLDDCVVVGVGGRWVQTSERTGVQDKHLARIKRLLSDDKRTPTL